MIYHFRIGYFVLGGTTDFNTYEKRTGGFLSVSPTDRNVTIMYGNVYGNYR